MRVEKGHSKDAGESGMRQFLWIFVMLIVVSGCASAQKLKDLPEDKLYFGRYALPETKKLHRQEFVSRHPEWSETVKQNVLSGQIDLGMSKVQVLSSMGKPIEAVGGDDPEKPSFAIWIYPKAYLIFETDKLQSINEKKRQNSGSVP
ncbi:MAG: hypothetical protein ABH891_10180 [Candidatus Omnitrophota bacterium]